MVGVKIGQKGFTLIELVVVIVIIGIMGLVVLPRIDLGGDRASALARKIVSDIRYAKHLSNTTRGLHGVVFTTASYTVFQNDDPASPTLNPETGNEFLVRMGGNFDGVVLSPSLGLGANMDVVKFNSIGRPFRRDGTPIDTAGGNQIIIAGGSVIKTVTIEPVTGNVSIN